MEFAKYINATHTQIASNAGAEMIVIAETKINPTNVQYIYMTHNVTCRYTVIKIKKPFCLLNLETVLHILLQPTVDTQCSTKKVFMKIRYMVAQNSDNKTTRLEYHGHFVIVCMYSLNMTHETMTTKDNNKLERIHQQ